jgi:hypothetical protein
MLSKRTQIWLALLDLALFFAVVGLTLTAGVPPARFPPKQKIMIYGILGAFVLSLLYRVIAQLPPIRFRIQTIMIVVAVVAVELAMARAIWPGAGWEPYVVAVVGTPAVVRAWLTQPPPAEGPTGVRYITWKLWRFARKAGTRWGGRTRS